MNSSILLNTEYIWRTKTQYIYKWSILLVLDLVDLWSSQEGARRRGDPSTPRADRIAAPRREARRTMMAMMRSVGWLLSLAVQ